jgi:hypothetical protein
VSPATCALRARPLGGPRASVPLSEEDPLAGAPRGDENAQEKPIDAGDPARANVLLDELIHIGESSQVGMSTLFAARSLRGHALLRLGRIEETSSGGSTRRVGRAPTSRASAALLGKRSKRLAIRASW